MLLVSFGTPSLPTSAVSGHPHIRLSRTSLVLAERRVGPHAAVVGEPAGCLFREHGDRASRVQQWLPRSCAPALPWIADPAAPERDTQGDHRE